MTAITEFVECREIIHLDREFHFILHIVPSTLNVFLIKRIMSSQFRCQFWAQNGAKLAPYRTNSVLFQIRFQYILAHHDKMYWNLIWKSPGFDPFAANITQFGAKPTISGIHWSVMCLKAIGRRDIWFMSWASPDLWDQFSQVPVSQHSNWWPLTHWPHSICATHTLGLVPCLAYYFKCGFQNPNIP